MREIRWNLRVPAELAARVDGEAVLRGWSRTRVVERALLVWLGEPVVSLSLDEKLARAAAARVVASAGEQADRLVPAHHEHNCIPCRSKWLQRKGWVCVRCGRWFRENVR